MSHTAPTGPAVVMPTLRYRDGRAAIDFLCTAFGFEEQLVVPTPAAALPMPSSCSATGW